MLERSRDADLTPGWEHRFVAAIRLPPWATGVAIAAGLVATFLVHAYIIDFPIIDGARGTLLPVDGGSWTAFVFCLLAGYTFVAGRESLLRTGEDIADLAKLVPDADAAILRGRWAAALGAGLPRSRIIGAMGFALGAVITTIVMLTPGNFEARFRMIFLWFYPISVIQWWQIARAGYFTLLGVRVLREQADAGAQIDLLDLRSLEPFSRMGLRNAFTWIATTSIVLLLVLNIPIGYLGAAFPAVIGIPIFAGFAFLVPLRSARRLIRRAKATEGGRVNDEVRRNREAVFSSGAEADAAAARLPGLIAYRGLVDDVREWPLDMHTLARFALYLAIPLGGWFGGALVERFVDALLD